MNRFFIKSALLTALIVGGLSVSAYSQEIDRALKDRVQEAIDRNSPANEDMQERAADVDAIFKSKGFVELQAQMQARIVESLGVDIDEDSVDERELPESVVTIFVSSSMPLSVLRRYAAAMDKVGGGVLVFRGIPGGMDNFMPYARYVREIMVKDPDCPVDFECETFQISVLMDPFLFRDHDIGTVPAMTILPGLVLSRYCERPDANPRPVGDALIFGDASLFGLLTAFEKQTGSAIASAMSAELLRSGWTVEQK